MLATVGMLTALTGIALALHQRDLKRVLAYSSIENMGLITLALGVALWAQATSRPTVAALAMAGTLLHVWNHAAMKGLLFLAAGSVLHGAGTGNMERLGGLLKRMPLTGAALTFGAVAIAALPPLNGFTSKWLMYLALLNGGVAPGGVDRGLIALFAVCLLALVGGLAVVAFVRMTGVVLLGTSRSEPAATAHESSLWLLAPLGVLVGICLTLALLPHRVLTLLAPVLAQLDIPQEALASEALVPLGSLNGWLLGVLALVLSVVVWLSRRSVAGATWGCGYVLPTPRIQYTARSFSEMLAEHLLLRFLRPHIHRKVPAGLFPAPGEFTTQDPDPFTAEVYEPFFRCWARRFTHLRVLQQGHLHLYLMYILLTVVLAVAWMSARTWWRVTG
jgi:NADH:ubiquinone oxidoreductase subunit 5 (subunit L)/multisubunit Na+/H+ antiporter MnhA subunit